MNQKIYLDHNATTPVHQNVIENLTQWANIWGNPSSIHQSGRGGKSLLRESRKHLAKLMNASPLELVFNGGGSESNNMALQGVFNSIKSGKNQKFKTQGRNELIVSSVEHPSVLKTAHALKEFGVVVHEIPVNKNTGIDLEFYKSKLSNKTALVSVMFANNETGHIFPIKEMCEWAHELGSYFHCDAVQSLGKSVVDVKDWGVDLASFSAHKFYALKGCGVLFQKKGVIIDPLIFGGSQERRRRAGTENSLGIAAFGEVAKYSLMPIKNSGSEADSLNTVLEKNIRKMSELRAFLEKQLKKEISHLSILGEGDLRLPNTVNAFIEGINGETLLMNLDIEGVCVSTGAACSAGSSEPSPVLLAMGYCVKEAQKSLRLSIGWSTTQEELEIFVKTLKILVQRIRDLYEQGL